MGRLGVATSDDFAVLSLDDDLKALNPDVQQAYIDRAESLIARRYSLLTDKVGYVEDMKVAVVKLAERIYRHDDPDSIRLAAQGITRFSAGSYSQSNDGKVNHFADPEIIEILAAYGTAVSGSMSGELNRDPLCITNDSPSTTPTGLDYWQGVQRRDV